MWVSHPGTISPHLNSLTGLPLSRWLRAEATRLRSLEMCRVLAYLGQPIGLSDVLFDTDSSLVRQSYNPRMMNTFLNLAGFGMAAWDPRSIRAEDPFTYRATTLPA